jgi:hypothetical protein
VNIFFVGVLIGCTASIFDLIELQGFPVNSLQNFAINILSRDQATEISSEDLNYGIAILRIAWMLSLKLSVDHIQVLINAVIICIARVVETTDKLRFTELQLLEAQEQERHNFEGLENGLMVINDILEKKGLFADTINDFDILSDIFRLFKYLTLRMKIWTGWAGQIC